MEWNGTERYAMEISFTSWMMVMMIVGYICLGHQIQLGASLYANKKGSH